MTPQEFVVAWTGPAQSAASQLGVPWQWILAQWGLESGFGTAPASTPAAANLARNNPADLGGPGNWQYFSSPASFVASYVATVRKDYGSAWAALSGNPGIGPVLAAPQNPSWSYYGSQAPAAYAGGLQAALANLQSITGQDVPISLTTRQLTQLRGSAQTQTQTPAQTQTQTQTSAATWNPATWLPALESWAGAKIALGLQLLLGLALMALGIYLMVSGSRPPQKVEVKSRVG